MTLFNLGGEKKKHEQALRFISEIKGHPEPLRVEIENTPFQFYSKSTVRAGVFVFTIHISIQPHLAGKNRKLMQRIDRRICPDAYKGDGEDDVEGQHEGS